MNRAEKRKLAKRINTPQKLEAIIDRVLSQKENDIKNEYDKKLVGYIEVFVVMMCYVLELEDITKDRIPQIASRVLFNIDSFRTGELEKKDYDLIKKEVESWGIKF